MSETRDDMRLQAAAESPHGRPYAAAESPHGRPSTPAESPGGRPPATTLELPSCDPVARLATPADLPAITAMVREAFGYDLEARLVERLEREGRVAVSVVAVSDGRVAGHALLSRVELIAPGEVARPALALAPVAVAPGLQGRGIGSLVVRTCVRLADPRLPVFVIGDPAFYGRFGFEPAVPRRIRQRFEVAPGHFMVLLAGAAPATPVERTLDYPAAFDGF